MQVIEQHPYVEQVVTPLDGESAVGPRLEEDADLDFLESEIMKIGSLNHADIDWGRVEHEALKILSARSKDLKVLGFLLLALQRGGDGERFALSLYLLSSVQEAWWDSGWPYPGDKGKRARKMLFTQILQRACKAVEGVSFDASLGDGRSFCLEVLDRLRAQAQQQELPIEVLEDLRRAVDKLPQAQDAGSDTVSGSNSEPGKEPGSSRAEKERTSQVSSSPATAQSLGDLILDPGNERATRQSLLKVAEMLTNAEPDRPLGYQLRRYAIWQNITSVPPVRDGKRSDLAAVSTDRIAEYREALEKSPDSALWQRIEQSLSVSPFWFEGHQLSAAVATALGFDACADAIRTAVSEFIERLPKLADLTFNDGTPFLSPDTQDWLWSAPAHTSGPLSSSASPWEQAYDSARELMTRKGLAAGMQLLEDGLAGAREPREQFYWRLTSVRLMKDAGLAGLAARQVQDLRQQIGGLAIENWEPALLKQLERLA